MSFVLITSLEDVAKVSLEAENSSLEYWGAFQTKSCQIRDAVLLHHITEVEVVCASSEFPCALSLGYLCQTVFQVDIYTTRCLCGFYFASEARHWMTRVS